MQLREEDENLDVQQHDMQSASEQVLFCLLSEWDVLVLLCLRRPGATACGVLALGWYELQLGYE